MSKGLPLAVVTGGAQGIGKAIAKRLLEKGMNVVIADVDEGAGHQTVQELHHLGGIRFVTCDVATEADVQHLMAETVRQYHGIDALINNAGISIRRPVTELTLEQWQRVIGVNLTGTFLCSKHAAPHLRIAKGNIVNIASTRALMSEAETEAYSASKGGIVALTHALAVSLGPDIRVNCVSPGWIEVGDWKKSTLRHTPKHSDRDRAQHPVGRVGNPEDVAALVEYLISSEAGFITGTNIVVDGGMTRKMIYEE